MVQIKIEPNNHVMVVPNHNSGAHFPIKRCREKCICHRDSSTSHASRTGQSISPPPSLFPPRFSLLLIFATILFYSFSSQIPISQNPIISYPKAAFSTLPSSQIPFYVMTVSSAESSVNSTLSLSGLAPLEAVLFDIDGTLCDSDPIHCYAFREMLQEIGFNGAVPITEEFFVENIAGKHNEDIAALLFPDDHQRGVKFCDDKEAMFRRLAKEQVKPINGLYKLTKWVEDRGLKRAAVTNAPRPNAELMISILGLSDFFDFLVIGSECERAKPFPDPYLKALEVLKVSKDHTFVFEDSVSGIKAGVAAGMPVVGLMTRNPEHLLMEAKPVFLIKDYEDPKLWAALEDLDRKASVTTGAT